MSGTRSVIIADEVLKIIFSNSLTLVTREADCVIDQTDFGEVVGIEILDFRSQLSGGSLENSDDYDGIHTAYDNEIDAFYVRIRDDASQVQTTARAEVDLDDKNKVVSLKIEIPKSRS
jgi:uncharacterized protein YuzE